jgi:serine/threonine-protein kinase
MELYPGAVVAARYRVDRKIGAGGMGHVWAGEHVAIGMRVALKTLPPETAKERHLVARFRREAQLLGRLRSERVARVVDFVEDGDFGLVLVMDLVEGEPLGAILAVRRLGVDEAIEVGVDIASALSDLHRAKVVHRDLKPDNVILQPVAGGRRRAVIVDLGVSRVEVDAASNEAVESLTQSDMAVGTLPYMAPEQLLSSSTATAAADIYALGAILYRAVSGEQVFGKDDDAVAAQRKLTTDAPPLSMSRIDRVATGLAALVARALEREPAHRFATAEEMLGELMALAELSHAMALDHDAPTEQALPFSANGAISGAAITEGEATRRMSRPPVEPDAIEDLPTQLSPASQALPRSEEVLVSGPVTSPATTPPVATRNPLAPPSSRSEPSNASSRRLARTTVASPVLALVPPKSPPTLTSLPEAKPPEPRAVPVRTAALGMLAALLAGALLGYGAHALRVRPHPPPAASAPP